MLSLNSSTILSTPMWPVKNKLNTEALNGTKKNTKHKTDGQVNTQVLLRTSLQRKQPRTPKLYVRLR